MNIENGDILIMKKVHPGCGSDRMNVIKTGADIKLSCAGCGRVIVMPLPKCEKNIRSIVCGKSEEKP